ncbi:MAG: mechanosensitive ion channel family protein [Candidatus Binatia bacterium]|nr:mechanosensitive ion channel family protein [Candidatus Binatia bacterium]
MNEFENALRILADFHQHHPWFRAVLTLGLTVVGVGVVNFGVRFGLRRLGTRFKGRRPFLQITADAIDRPLNLITWLLVAWLVVPFAIGEAGSDLSAYLPVLNNGAAAVSVLLMSWALWRVAAGTRLYLLAKYSRTDGGYNDFSVIETGNLAARASIVLFAVFSLLGALGIPLRSLTAVGVVGGFGAYALTMANQILISNIFAGFAIYLDRPFAVGDWISTKDGAVTGTVTKIGLRLTTIVGFDKRPIYVPNSVFNENATVNPSRMSNRRILQYVGLRYDDLHRVGGTLQAIRSYLEGHQEIDQDKLTLVNLVNGSTDMGSAVEGCFGASSINFMVYTFTKTTNWVRFQNIQDEVMLNIARIVEEQGAEIAFSTITLEAPKPLTLAAVPPAVLLEPPKSGA